MAYYGVQWTEINRAGYFISKRKEFAAVTARERFIARLRDRPGFVSVDATCEGV